MLPVRTGAPCPLPCMTAGSGTGRLPGKPKMRTDTQPAALGHTYARLGDRVAHQPVRGHHGERLVDLVDME